MCYSTEEFEPFSLTPRQLAQEVRKIFARKLLQLYSKNRNKVFSLQQPAFSIISRKTLLPDMTGEWSVLLLLHLNLTINNLQFLRHAHN